MDKNVRSFYFRRKKSANFPDILISLQQNFLTFLNIIADTFTHGLVFWLLSTLKQYNLVWKKFDIFTLNQNKSVFRDFEKFSRKFQILNQNVYSQSGSKNRKFCEQRLVMKNPAVSPCCDFWWLRNVIWQCGYLYIARFFVIETKTR